MDGDMLNENHIPFDWYDIHNYYKRYSDIKSNLIYESAHITSKKYEVTIAIPTFCRNDMLDRALHNAVRQRGINNYEVIVVDNDERGNPETDSMIKDYCAKYNNIRYYRNEKNIGMTGNWNRCIEMARGKWVVLLHDDDVISDRYLKTVLPWAKKSKCSMIGVFHTDLYDAGFDADVNRRYGKTLKFRQNVLGYLRRKKPFMVKKTDIYANVYPSPVCAMFRKEKAIAFGGFDGKEGGAYDEKFFVTELYHGKVLILPMILAQRGVGMNESLRADIQKKAIAVKYGFAMHILEKENPVFKWYRKMCADISARYMIESVQGHFNAKVDFGNLLKELGISSFVIRMPRKMVTFFKYLPLLSLVFRRKY